MDSRQKFEEKYPLPEGMYFDNEQSAYAGTKDFWLWCARWESWQASRESLVVELPEVHRDVTFDDESIDLMWPDEVIKAIHEAGIRTK